MKRTLDTALPAILLAGAALIAGCGGGSNSDYGDSDETAANTQSSWLAQQAPQNVVDVASAKKDAGEGDRIAVRGVIGGRLDAISKESAVFVIMDPSIPSCADNPEDACRTPWDYCCETPETIAANSATVQIVGAGDGASIRGAGLSELDEVIVEGAVGPRPSGDVLVIRADSVYRVPG